MSEEKSFCFLVMERSGAHRKKFVTAESTEAARRKLQREGVVPLKELKIAEKKLSHQLAAKRRGKFDVLGFTSRLSPLLDANVPLEKALAVLEDGAPDGFSRQVIFDLRCKLHEGRRFSELLRESPGNFPEIYSGLVAAGEESGNLARVVHELRNFLAESKEFKDFVVTSSIYPVSVVVVTLAVVITLFTVFVPRFAKVFADMGQELPALTKAMLRVSEWMTGGWYWIFLPIGLWLLLKYLRKRSQRVRLAWDKLMLRMPLTGQLTISIQMSNFMQAMAIMTGGHVHLLNALKVSLRMISNQAILASFESVADELKGGGKISDVLGRVPYLPQGSAAMLKVAEESGEIGNMFARIAAEEQGATRLKFKRLMVLLEPIVIVVLAVMVMLVVLAVFTAIWKMNSLR